MPATPPGLTGPPASPTRIEETPQITVGGLRSTATSIQDLANQIAPSGVDILFIGFEVRDVESTWQIRDFVEMGVFRGFDEIV